jgi:hypothetical protein
MKTAMQELKDKIQTAIGDFNGQLTNYNAGWKQCLITIQNQIDDELLEKEKEQIMNAYCDGAKGGANGNKGQHDFGWVSRYTRKKYYNQKYNQKQNIIDIIKADEDDDLYNQIN